MKDFLLHLKPFYLGYSPSVGGKGLSQSPMEKHLYQTVGNTVELLLPRALCHTSLLLFAQLCCSEAWLKAFRDPFLAFGADLLEV